jgi:Na+/H+ antiporter NhaD/arsenite permease-like protein
VQGYIIAAVIFGIVYVLIIGRRRFHIPIWLSMLIGAILMLAFQVISLESALKSINLDVIGFLFGMFSIVTALDKSGMLKLIALRMLARAKDLNSLVHNIPLRYKLYVVLRYLACIPKETRVVSYITT